MIIANMFVSRGFFLLIMCDFECYFTILGK